MTKQTMQLSACALAAGLMAAVSGCKCPVPPAGAGTEVTSQIAMAGATVSLAAEPKLAGWQKDEPVRYQWAFNGADIAGATKGTFTIKAMKVSDVGIYSLAVRSGEKKLATKPVAVSMLSTNMGGDSGSLTALIGDFTISGGCCGVTYDKYKVYLPFDGRFTTSPSASFPNPNNRTNLTVDTFSTNNPTVDTCVMIQQSFVPFSVLACNNDFSPPPLANTKLSKCTAPLAPNKKYRVGVCFRSSTLGGATKVTWNYLYHN